MKYLILITALLLSACKKDDPTPLQSSTSESECECIEYIHVKNASTNYEWEIISEEPVLHPSCQDSIIEHDVQTVGTNIAWYIHAISCEE